MEFTRDETFMKIDKKTIIAIIALAFFNVVFLGTEYLYDNMMACVTGAENVVLTESYILGASCIGFFLFPFFNKILKKGSMNLVTFAGALVGIICIFIIWQHGSYYSILIAGCILFILLGVLGSAVHYMTGVLISDKKYLARCIGVAYALGIFLQFVNNNFVLNDMVESIVLAVSLAVFVVLIIKMEDSISLTDDSTPANILGKQEKQGTIMKNPVIAVTAMICAIVLMSCIFSTLNVSVTLVHASGSVDIGQWPRLLLGASGLAAGFLYDIKERKYMNMIMYCVTLLSTICVFVSELGGPFLVGLLIFYLSAGFFVVFFSTVFIDLSFYIKCPQLWSGMGRAINNACAIFTGSLSVLLLSGGGTRIILVALVLFVLISIALFVYTNQFETCAEEKPELYELSDEERFAAFCQAFSITEREQEVLEALLVSDENVQDIAVKLSISRAVLYRHITSLNNKTQTKSRIGLLQFYYTWKDKK